MEESKIQVGDTVECLDAGGYTGKLTVGKRYACIKVSERWMTVEQDDGSRTCESYVTRWKKAEYPALKVDWKVGDTVQCIDDSWYGRHLTAGKEYEVLDMCEKYTVTLSDEDKQISSFHSRFKKVEDRQISGLTETQKAIIAVCDRVKEQLLDKNRKYGDSAIHPKRVFSKASAVEQINVRLDDKISRIMSAQEDDTEDAEFDLLGYLMLKMVAKEVHNV